MSDPVYCYPPDHTVLRNKLGIRDAAELDITEREYSSFRIGQGCPKGDFDLNHLRAIHAHIFQDVYDWAGALRTVEIRKGGTQFMPQKFIETGMVDVHRRLAGANHLHGLGLDAFAEQAGEIIGDVNHIHPFREGNGRTQLQYLKQLAERADITIDLRQIDPTAWIDASIRSDDGDYRGMQKCIRSALIDRDRERAEEIARKREKGRENDRGHGR